MSYSTKWFAFIFYTTITLLSLSPCLVRSTENAEVVPEFSPRKIVLLHLHDNAPFFGDLGALTLSNKQRYCARHNYELASWSPTGVTGLWKVASCDDPNAVKNPHFHLHESNDGDIRAPVPPECVTKDDSFAIDARAPTFGKIKLTLAACRTRPNYWALWSDADAMIINQTMPLESIIDDAYDIMLSVDWLMLNAGVMLFKCSKWTQDFLHRVYSAQEFDEALALDQSAFQHFIDSKHDSDTHVKRIPKHVINAYAEEYRPGDFLLHLAGKLFEMTPIGATAVAHQFDILSTIDDVQDVEAFFQGQYILNKYSGICDTSKQGANECSSEDGRRIKLDKPLISMSMPNRYHHVGLRYYWLRDWKDTYDVGGWNDGRKLFDPNGTLTSRSNKSRVSPERIARSKSGKSPLSEHDEL